MMADILSAEDDKQEGDELIHPVMSRGQRIAVQPSLHDIRAHAQQELQRLSLELKAARSQVPYPVQVSTALEQLAAVADQRMKMGEDH